MAPRNMDELFGSYVGEEELVGAAGPRAISPVAARGVAQSRPGRIKRTTQGFDSVANVAAGASLDIEVTPQVAFRPERMTVDDTISGAFNIDDIKIGNKSMLPSSDAIPASVFTPAATDSQVAFDTCQVGQKITLSVTNVSVAAARFRGAMTGSTLER